MNNSIHQFVEKGVKNLTKIFESYTDDLTKIAEMVQGVTAEVVNLGTSIIAEEWESYDELLRKRKDLRSGWHIVRKDAVVRTTSLGDVRYERTLFKNVNSGTSCYLLDQLMQLEKHTRITEDAEARILEEAVESSYRKGGINASIIGANITKETVMNKIHVLKFPSAKVPNEKKQLPKLYIDTDALKIININGDGASWIKSGAKYIKLAKFVLDKYHMHKYIVVATAHLKDSKEDARAEIYRAIHKKKKYMAEEVFDKILAVTEDESKQKAVLRAKGYILENWSGIMLSMAGKKDKVGCSAEGHVSHVYSDRMSSRPLGWCHTGADKMAHLRIYRQNKGNMLELVRYQKEELPMAEGAEEVIYSASEMIAAENRNRKRLGTLADVPIYSIPYPQIKKIAALKNHIWGL